MAGWDEDGDAMVVSAPLASQVEGAPAHHDRPCGHELLEHVAAPPRGPESRHPVTTLG